jgi:Chlorophyllase enzyme
VTSAAKSARRIAAGEMIAIVFALITACSGHAQPPAAATTVPPPVPKSATASARPTTSDPSPLAAAVGVAGRYRVAERQLTFVEPPHTGPTGEHLGQRRLATTVWYPLAGSRPAAGPLPLLMFAPGFMMCSGPYSSLLETWASAGYVVAAVNFPRTNCHLGAAAYEPDLVNQPRDVSYALTRLLALSAEPSDLFSGLIDRQEVGAAGQSDGGDTDAALAANGCCTDHRLTAVAVLSGAEWPPMPGRYFAHGAPPMLFVQGSADTINPPWASLQLYRADQARARYYLDLFGMDHLTPYTGANPVERLVARVTLAFFNRYVLGQADALATMTREGNVSGVAVLVSGGEPPP